MWSAESIKHKLNQLAAEGLIERKRIFDGSRETSLYFRSRTRNARPAASSSSGLLTAPCGDFDKSADVDRFGEIGSHIWSTIYLTVRGRVAV